MPQEAPSRLKKPFLPFLVGLPLVAVPLIRGFFLLIRDAQPPKPGVQTSVINRANAELPAEPVAGSLTPAKPLTPARTFVDPAAANFDKEVFRLAAPDGVRNTSDNYWSIKDEQLFMQ